MPGDTDNLKKARKGGQKPRRGRQGHTQASKPTGNTTATEPTQEPVPNADEEAQDDEIGENVCHICAESMDKKLYAVAECNHRTCHACALRLRALYKKLDCTFCKMPQPVVIITSSADRPFESYAPEDLIRDMKMDVYFETQEMMEDCLLLLRFNCPDVSCDYIAAGWPELKHHTRTVHGLLLCNLCLRYKKIFSHEHTLYTPQQLAIHLPTARTFALKHASTSAGSEIDVHPICEFCDEALYGEDEHFSHMRQRHEECFVCKAGGIRHQYFQNYNSLERHFQTGHHPCPHPECVAQKFVVFATTLDLQAHVLEKHGEKMSNRDLRDLRRVEAGFAPSEPSRSAQRRDRTDRPQVASQSTNDRDPSTHTSSTGPTVTSTSRRQQAFSGNLSNNDAAPTPSASVTSTTGMQSALAQQETAFISRLSAATHGSATAEPAVRAAIRAYRTSESSARDLLDTLFTILGQELDATASFVPSLVNILDNEEKKLNLMTAWKAFKTEQEEQFPVLSPASSSSQPSAHSKRAVQVKKLQANDSRRRVWDRVAQAASSTPPVRQASTFATPSSISSTPWSRSGAGPSSSSTTRSEGVRPSKKAPAPSLTAFPSLPPSNVSRAPKEFVTGQSSLRAMMGPPVAASAWGSSGPSTPQESEVEEGTQSSKKKKNAKQTLFTLGSLR